MSLGAIVPITQWEDRDVSHTNGNLRSVSACVGVYSMCVCGWQGPLLNTIKNKMRFVKIRLIAFRACKSVDLSF